MLRDGRSYLAEAFVGLGATVYGTFDRKEGSGYLFRYIRVEGVQANGKPFVGREHHLWIFRGCKMIDLMQYSMKQGDKFRIKGEPYLYRIKNGTYDFSIQHIHTFEKIRDYDFPTAGELPEQKLQKCRCVFCFQRDRCNGFCTHALFAQDSLLHPYCPCHFWSVHISCILLLQSVLPCAI